MKLILRYFFFNFLFFLSNITLQGLIKTFVLRERLLESAAEFESEWNEYNFGDKCMNEYMSRRGVVSQNMKNAAFVKGAGFHVGLLPKNQGRTAKEEWQQAVTRISARLVNPTNPQDWKIWEYIYRSTYKIPPTVRFSILFEYMYKCLWLLCM